MQHTGCSILSILEFHEFSGHGRLRRLKLSDKEKAKFFVSKNLIFPGYFIITQNLAYSGVIFTSGGLSISDDEKAFHSTPC